MGLALLIGELDDEGFDVDDNDDGIRMGLRPCLGLFGNLSKLSKIEASS